MRLVLIFICFNYLNIFSQETIDVKFNEATPLWVHTMIDSTFVPVVGQPYFTKYSSLSPLNITRSNNHVYIMASSLEKQSLDDHGFVLDKIDINSGSKLWTHHNTSYTGGQKDIYHNLQIKENKIEMVGTVEDVDQKYYSSYKIIDTESGQLLKYVKSNNPLPEFSKRYFTGFVLQSDSILLNAYTIGDDVGNQGDPLYNYGINAETFDQNMNQI